MNIARKTLVAFLLIAFTATPLLAATQETAEFRKNYGTIKTKVQPRGIDKTAVNLSKQYAAGKNTPQPIMGKNGAVVYQYGSTVVRVICRTLRITDIELEEGETVTSAPFIGDSINWQVLPSASGSGDKLKYHIMIKPSMPDLSTNLVVHTDRRSYHFELVSSKTDHTPLIKFSYPQMQTQQGGATGWQEFIAQRVAKKQAQENEYKIPYFDAGVMDDDYVIQGKKSIKWFPKRVYTDGIKTYIEFNSNLSNIESPVFQIVRNNSREMVNYRQIGNIYVVDYLFDVGVLLAGSGRQQQKVVIRRVKSSTPVEQIGIEENQATYMMTETDSEGRVIENYAPRKTYSYDELVAQSKANEIAKNDERKRKEEKLAERLEKLEARKKEREAKAAKEQKAREAEEQARAKAAAEKQARIEAEQKKLEEAKQKAQAEAEKKAKEAEEKARKAKEAREKALAEKQARIEAEQKRLEEEKARAAEAERVRKEAEAAKAAKEAEQKAKLQDIQKKKLDILKRIEEIQKNRQK